MRWWDGWSLGLVFARQSSTCQLCLDVPLPALTKPRIQNNRAHRHSMTMSRPPKIRKLLRYGIYTAPEIWICYCDVTVLYSGHSEHSQTYASVIIQAKFHLSTTDVAFYTWKLERLQVHHGIGKLEHLLSNVHLQSMSLLTFIAGELECTLFKECFFGGEGWLFHHSSYNRTSPGACRAPARACERGQVGWGCLVWRAIPLVHGPIVTALRVCTVCTWCTCFFQPTC